MKLAALAVAGILTVGAGAPPSTPTLRTKFPTTVLTTDTKQPAPGQWVTVKAKVTGEFEGDTICFTPLWWVDAEIGEDGHIPPHVDEEKCETNTVTFQHAWRFENPGQYTLFAAARLHSKDLLADPGRISINVVGTTER